MALPVYQQFGEGKDSGATFVYVPISQVLPEAGDLLIGFLSSDGGGETYGSPEEDSWNIIYANQSEGSGKQTFSCWWKIATGDEGHFRFTCGSPEALYAWVIRISGTHQTDPIHKKVVTTGDSGNVIFATLTTEVNDCLIIYSFGIDHIDVTEDGGWDSGNNITVDKSGTGANDCAGGSNWANLVNAGNAAYQANTLTGTEEYVSITIAIQPPAGGIFYQSVAGVFSLTGAVNKTTKISLAGVLSSTGSLIRKTLLNLAGNFGLTGIVSSIFKFPKSLAGAFGLTGTVVKLPKINLSGILSATGTIVKLPKIILSGVFSPTGVVSSIWKSFQSLVGSFNFTGSVNKLTKKALAGTFDFTGNILRKIKISLSGIFGSTGTISSVLKKFKSLSGVFDLIGSGVGQLLGGIVYKSLSGAFDFSGGVGRKIYKSIAGVFNFTGTITSILTIFKSLAGSFDLTGTIVKLPKILLSGVFNSTGSIARKVMISLSGAFNFTGSLGRLIKKGLSGAFSFLGSGIGQLLGGIFYKSLSGTFGFIGTVSTVKTIFKALVGSFDFSGVVSSTKRYIKTLLGMFDFSGNVGRLIRKTLSGTFTLTGYFKFKTFWHKVIKAIDGWTRVVKDGVFRRLK